MSGPQIIHTEVRRQRIWRFTGHIKEGSVPDMRVKIRTTIRPSWAHVVFVAEEGDDEPHVEKVIVSGRRVLVNGTISKVESREEYGRWDWDGPDAVPEWLRIYVKGLEPSA